MQDQNPIAASLKALSKDINPAVPNPAPLGLIAFGLTTALLQVKHARFGGDSAASMGGVDVEIMGFSLFFGGLLQVLAGQNEIKRNNLFGYTAFSLYGGFWMSVGIIKVVTLLATATPVYLNPKAVEAMLLISGFFSLMLWSLTFAMNKTICSLFGLLCLTFLFLALGVNNETLDIIGGWFGILTGANAFWLAYAELVNDIYGKGTEIIPLGQWNWVTERKHLKDQVEMCPKIAVKGVETADSSGVGENGSVDV